MSTAISNTAEFEQISRQAIKDNQPAVLPEIYKEDTNIVIWQRNLDNTLVQAADHILSTQPQLQASILVNPKNAYNALNDVLGDAPMTNTLSEDIAHLTDMFCYLFELNNVGLRLTALDRAMCPRFHVDRVPCRLVTTYRGVASQWLPHSCVDRTKLGPGSEGKSDDESGLFSQASDIQQLNEGDVALLKGEYWQGNEGAGLVHRSPMVPQDSLRLLLTLDFTNR